MIKIEAEIYEMKAGEITKIITEGKIFSVTEYKQPTEQPTEIEVGATERIKFAIDDSQTSLEDQFGLGLMKKQPAFMPKDKGEVVSKCGDQSIHRNILNDVNNLLGNSGNNSPRGKDFVNLMQPYYPELKMQTLVTYGNLYKRHIASMKSGISLVPVKRRKKYRRRKPADAVGFCKTYGVWIKKDERLRVRQAISKWGTKASAVEIKKIAKISLGRVNAILRYLRDEHEVYYKPDDEGTPIYYLT